MYARRGISLSAIEIVQDQVAMALEHVCAYDEGTFLFCQQGQQQINKSI